MKNLLIILVVLLSVTGLSPAASAQKKGEIYLGIGSGVFNVSSMHNGVTSGLYNNFSQDNSSRSNTSSSFAAMLGFFPGDKLRLDAGMQITSYGEGGAVSFLVGGRYFYKGTPEEKLKLNGGLSISTNSGGGAPNLSLTPIEMQYFPFEGGGFTTDFTYTLTSIGDDHSGKSFGVNIGLLIKLK